MFSHNKRPLAVLHLRAYRAIGAFIGRMRGIALNMSNHPEFFPLPSPALAVFSQHIDELVMAEAEASRRTTGAVSTRNLHYNTVLIDVHSLQNYVQNLADNAKDEFEAIKIILSSGFDLKETSSRKKRSFEAKNGKISGTVELVAKATPYRTAYQWQMSDDKINWTVEKTTRKASVIFRGIKSPSIKYFRYCYINKDDNQSSWSQIVELVVK